MTILDGPTNLTLTTLNVTSESSDSESGCDNCCGSCESGDQPSAVPSPAPATVPPGFAAAITMAEAAANHNPTWWNEIRCHADDPAVGEYCSSMLLGAFLQSSAHRLGVPTADAWAHIRRTGELPL